MWVSFGVVKEFLYEASGNFLFGQQHKHQQRTTVDDTRRGFKNACELSCVNHMRNSEKFYLFCATGERQREVEKEREKKSSQFFFNIFYLQQERYERKFNEFLIFIRFSWIFFSNRHQKLLKIFARPLACAESIRGR